MAWLVLAAEWPSACHGCPQFVGAPSAALAALGIFMICACALSFNVLIMVWRESQKNRCMNDTDDADSDSNVETITIHESPMPTRMSSSPFPLTTSIARRRREFFEAHRGGRSRLPRHRRLETRLLNPTLPHHCAYVCILKIIGKRANLRNVKILRDSVSCMIRRLYEDQAVLYGIDVAKMVDESYDSVDDYVKHVQVNQWASIIELHCASELTDASFVVKSKNGHVKMGRSLHPMSLRTRTHTTP